MNVRAPRRGRYATDAPGCRASGPKTATRRRQRHSIGLQGHGLAAPPVGLRRHVGSPSTAAEEDRKRLSALRARCLSATRPLASRSSAASSQSTLCAPPSRRPTDPKSSAHRRLRRSLRPHRLQGPRTRLDHRRRRHEGPGRQRDGPLRLSGSDIVNHCANDVLATGASALLPGLRRQRPPGPRSRRRHSQRRRRSLRAPRCRAHRRRDR